MAQVYPLLHTAHYWLSRAGIVIGLAMLVIALYIGLAKHGDVTKWFRRGVYAMIGFVGVEFLIGVTMYLMGGRPSEDVHLIYGVGALLSLPFFVFVETTAKKRPAMGSYMWGFTLVVAIFVRSIMTGAAG
jgi:peptidoglycan/LPS O-acetylase OafA/YrhL